MYQKFIMPTFNLNFTTKFRGNDLFIIVIIFTKLYEKIICLTLELNSI